MTSSLKEFDIESFAAEEKMVLDGLTSDNSKSVIDPLEVSSTGPVESTMDIEGENESVSINQFGFFHCNDYSVYVESQSILSVC